MKSRLMTLFAGTVVFFSFIQEATAQWVETSGPHGGKVWALAISGPYLFAGTENGGVYVTKDNGDSWSMASVGLPRGEAVNCLIISGTNLFAGTPKGLFMSVDNGASWQPRNSGLPENLFVRCLAVMGTRLFAGGGKAGLFSSADNGITWELRNRGLPRDNDIWCFAVSSSNLFVGTIHLVPGVLSRPTTIFLTRDDGASWEKASLGFPSEALLDCLAASGPNIFAGTFLRGVLRYTDRSKKWSPANSGIPETAIFCFAANSTDLFAGW